MASGNFSKVQVGVETAYGTPVAATAQVKIFNEGFKYVPSKKEEGLLTGGKTTGLVYTMGKKVEGSLSTLARPDDAGLFLALALGKEAAVTTQGTLGKKHTFTAAGASDKLPSATFRVDKVVKVFQYDGCKVDTLSFNAAAEDYLKLDIGGIIGQDEADGTLTPALNYSPLKPFKFSGCTVKFGATSVEATSVKFDYSNALDGSLQTTNTGLYYAEPEQNARDIKVEVETLYNSTTDGLRTSYFKTDDVVAIEIKFTSDEEIETDTPYTLTITLPNCQITEASPVIGGAERIKQTISAKAVEVGSTEPITVELVNTRATKYI